jgi:hypothetical protein
MEARHVRRYSEAMAMDAKGFVVPSGGGSLLSMAPGRSAALKLLGADTGDGVMLFEETAPVGAETTFHLHGDSDEVAYVLSGEIPSRSATRSRPAEPAPAHFCRAACRMPGKTPAPKQLASCSSTRRPGPAAFSRNS